MVSAHRRNVIVTIALALAALFSADAGVWFAHIDPTLAFAVYFLTTGTFFLWLANVVPSDAALGKTLEEQFYYLWRDRRYWRTLAVVFYAGAAWFVVAKVW